jgi:hypothetical protein
VAGRRWVRGRARQRRPVGARVVRARPQLSRDPLGGHQEVELALELEPFPPPPRALARSAQRGLGCRSEGTAVRGLVFTGRSPCIGRLRAVGGVRDSPRARFVHARRLSLGPPSSFGAGQARRRRGVRSTSRSRGRRPGLAGRAALRRSMFRHCRVRSWSGRQPRLVGSAWVWCRLTSGCS